MRWYTFTTIKGSMAVLMEGNTLYRLMLPSSYADIQNALKDVNTENIQISDIPDQDNSIPFLNKIRNYYKGDVIKDWEVKPDISTLSPFYRQTLEYEFTIPYGETMTYGEVARAVGNPKASRAVGSANKNNPIPLIIP